MNSGSSEKVGVVGEATHSHDVVEVTTFPFLIDLPSEQTFELAKQNLDAIFGGLKDKHGNDLMQTYGRKECLRVLARVDYVAQQLKIGFRETAICHPNDPAFSFTPDLTEHVRRAIIDLTPAGNPTPVSMLHAYGKANGGISVSDGVDTYYQYPAWDRLVKPGQEYKMDQEYNFYRNLLVHVMTTELFIDELGGKINEYIEKANEEGWSLEEGSFGALRQQDEKYGQIDLERLKVRMLFHDIGRWISHHPVLHETLPDLIANAIGLKPPLIKHEFNHDYRYYQGGDERVLPENIYIEEVLFHYIDFVVKRHDENDLNGTKLRSLDQLAEHAISRAANYNGELQDFLELERKKAVQAGRELYAQEKVNLALAFLQKNSSDSQGQFYRREILFLQRVLPFFGTDSGNGILGALGTNLHDIQNTVEQRWNDSIESGELLTYRKPQRQVFANALDNAFLGKEPA